MLLIKVTFAVCNNNNVYNAQTKNVFVTCLYTLVQQKRVWSISSVMIYDKHVNNITSKVNGKTRPYNF